MTLWNHYKYVMYFKMEVETYVGLCIHWCWSIFLPLAGILYLLMSDINLSSPWDASILVYTCVLSMLSVIYQAIVISFLFDRYNEEGRRGIMKKIEIDFRD